MSTLIRHIQRLLKELAELIMPRVCPVCGQRLMATEKQICATCIIQWPRLPWTDCTDNIMLRTLWTEVPVEYAYSLISYRHHSPFHQLLMNMKYKGNHKLAFELGRWAAMEMKHLPVLFETDLLIPVPLSRKRKIERGYNQAEEIAKGIADVCHKPVCTPLRRKESRSSQTHLNKAERKENAHDLYYAHIPEHLQGKHILLIDDVMTTGATLCGCIQALLKEDETLRISIFTLALSM